MPGAIVPDICLLSRVAFPRGSSGAFGKEQELKGRNWVRQAAWPAALLDSSRLPLSLLGAVRTFLLQMPALT